MRSFSEHLLRAMAHEESTARWSAFCHVWGRTVADSVYLVAPLSSPEDHACSHLSARCVAGQCTGSTRPLPPLHQVEVCPACGTTVDVDGCDEHPDVELDVAYRPSAASTLGVTRAPVLGTDADIERIGGGL